MFGPWGRGHLEGVPVNQEISGAIWWGLFTSHGIKGFHKEPSKRELVKPKLAELAELAPRTEVVESEPAKKHCHWHH